MPDSIETTRAVATAADIGDTSLRFFHAQGGQLNIQLDAVGAKGLLHQFGIELAQPRLEQRQFRKSQCTPSRAMATMGSRSARRRHSAAVPP